MMLPIWQHAKTFLPFIVRLGEEPWCIPLKGNFNYSYLKIILTLPPINRFHLDEQNGTVPFFLFGDFNFRCDTEGVVKVSLLSKLANRNIINILLQELTENLTPHRVQNVKNENDKIHYRNSTGNNVLTVGKKEFSHADHQLKFKEDWVCIYYLLQSPTTNI